MILIIIIIMTIIVLMVTFAVSTHKKYINIQITFNNTFLYNKIKIKSIYTNNTNHLL